VERLHTVPEVADKLQVKPPTLYTWVSQNKIEHIRVGRLIRFSTQQIEKFLTSMSRGVSRDTDRREHQHKIEQAGKDR
jgi:excisionase family DNA binding protein